MRSRVLFAALVLSISVPALASSIQMLPPVQSNDTTSACKEKDAGNNSEGNKILTWDGSNAIKCNKGVTVNATGNVGIGTTTPQNYAVLDVNTSNNKSIHTMDSANGGLLMGYAGSTIQARTTAEANTQNLILQGWGGNVGVGTAAPTSKLDVNGSVKIGADVAVCDGTKSGAVRWTGTAMEYCNGTAWTAFGGSPECKMFHADTLGNIDAGTRIIYSNEMIKYTCPASYPKFLSGSCWRINSGTYIGDANDPDHDGKSYMCRIEGGNGVNVYVTCCK